MICNEHRLCFVRSINLLILFINLGFIQHSAVEWFIISATEHFMSDSLFSVILSLVFLWTIWQIMKRSKRFLCCFFLLFINIHKLKCSWKLFCILIIIFIGSTEHGVRRETWMQVDINAKQSPLKFTS